YRYVAWLTFWLWRRAARRYLKEASCTLWVNFDPDCEQKGSTHPSSSAQCLYCQGNTGIEPRLIP
ncbi:hypothetical protein, partial [Litoreibacter halocynthiae]|uniref:hypothetical protein n=1 Tax=Litoreibacter halocynthiae TaxID=1242689 RepID=UPI002490AF54